MKKQKNAQRPMSMTDVHELFEGYVLVYRGSRSGLFWQFRMWISREKKYIKQTLETKDLELAVERAKKKS